MVATLYEPEPDFHLSEVTLAMLIPANVLAGTTNCTVVGRAFRHSQRSRSEIHGPWGEIGPLEGINHLQIAVAKCSHYFKMRRLDERSR